MRVLCIDNVGAPELVEGNVYNATQCPVYNECFDLAEIPLAPISNFTIPVSYKKIRFIPLSDEYIETEQEINLLKKPITSTIKND